ncbi:uncharacterized protein LOC132754553 [Ruditapes philippinarum]|uniref:uncharacterized protein LOC132754553 n=1 Tax=Ruditapes philippinarum TaxID=129788 RepID=UPI00295C007E|nr:uncharacterized protein LOC132754553 [Ruditapes philippinarum]
MIPITLNIDDIRSLKELNVNDPIHIKGSNEGEWGNDINEMRWQKLKKTLEEKVSHVAKERGDNRLRTEGQQLLVTVPSSATNMSNIPFFSTEQRSISDEVGSGEILHYPTEESAYLSVDGVTTSVSIPDNRHSDMPLPHESQEAINQQDDVAQQLQSLNLDTVDGPPHMNRFEMIEDVDLSIDTSPAETENHRPETIGGDESLNISVNTEVKKDSASFLYVTPTQDETDLKIPFANEDTPRLPDQRRLNLISTKNSPDSGYTTPFESISRPICPNIENRPDLSISTSPVETEYHRPETIGGDESLNISEVKKDSGSFLDVTPAQDETDLKIPFANEDTPRLPDQRRLNQISTKNSPDSGHTTPSESISRTICLNIENRPEIQTDDKKIKPQDNSSTTGSVKVKPPLAQASSSSAVIRPSEASLPMLDQKKPRSAGSIFGACLSVAVDSFFNSDLAFK